jgi:hypothetical protein
MSSDWQIEQTGVDRVARRLSISPGCVFDLNGLRSKSSLISSPLDLNSDRPLCCYLSLTLER